MVTVKVHDYAVYKNGRWDGEVIHYLMPLEKIRIEKERRVKLVSMKTHFKIQDRIESGSYIRRHN